MRSSDNLLHSKRGVTRLAILMCALGAIYYCYEYYLRVAPSVMSSELKYTFNLSDAAFGYLAAFYYYAYTPMQIPVGLLMDKFGPRRVLTLACFLCATGTYLFSITTFLPTAQFARFIIGFGSAFAYVGVLKISDVWLPKKYFALMAGVATALGMFGAMTGELIMAYFVNHVGWQATLFYSAIVGIILTIILGMVLRDSVGTTPIEQHAFMPTSTRNLFIGLIEMIKNPRMWLTGLIGCILFLPLSAFAEIWAVPFLERVGGMSKTDAAFGSSMAFLGYAVGGPLWGILSEVLKSRRIPLMLGSFASAVLMALAIKYATVSSYLVYVLLFATSFMASAEILVFAIAVDFNRHDVTATAVAFTNMLVMIGGAFLPPIIGMMLDRSVIIVDNLPVYGTEDYQTALMIIPIFLVLSGVITFFLKESYQANE